MVGSVPFFVYELVLFQAYLTSKTKVALRTGVTAAESILKGQGMEITCFGKIISDQNELARRGRLTAYK